MRLCGRRQQSPTWVYIPGGKYHDVGNGELDAHEIVINACLSFL
jgi:hypothetical protein